jgi:hypothetical protein
MRAAIALALALVVGCAHRPPQQADSRAKAAACVGLAFASLGGKPAPPPPAAKCCGQCGKNGLERGKVLSGDRLKIVPCGPTTCGCPADCACKKPNPTQCANGVCR